MESVITLAGARPLKPGKDVGAWHQTDTAAALLKAIVELHAVAGRLEALQHASPSRYEAREAASLVGRITNKQVLSQYSRDLQLTAAPSNGACAVSALWDALNAEREATIATQMTLEGLKPIAGILTPDQAETAFTRRDELDCEALGVGQVICFALSTMVN